MGKRRDRHDEAEAENNVDAQHDAGDEQSTDDVRIKDLLDDNLPDDVGTDEEAPPEDDPLVEAVTEDGAIAVETTKASDLRVPAWLDTSVQYTWRSLILIVGLVGVVYAMTNLYLVTLPIILALVLCTLCVPPARKLERMGMPRMLAAMIVVIGGLGSLIGIFALMTPMFIEQVEELQPTVIEGVNSVLEWLETGPLGWDPSQLDDLISQAMEYLEEQAATIAAQVGSIAMAVGQALTALVLALVLLFFFVKDGEQIVSWFISRVPEHHRDTVRATGARGWVALAGFVRGTAAVALIDAIGIGIGLAIVGVPLVLPLSVLVFFGGFIPVIGATATGILAVLVALASGGITDAIWVAAIVIAVQQFESNVLQPTIMRRAVALHPVVILGVLTAGAVLIGIIGAFLAVPIAAVLAAVGNELRLRHEIMQKGGIPGPLPVGGPKVDHETVSVKFPKDTQIRAAARRRSGAGPRGRQRSKASRQTKDFDD